MKRISLFGFCALACAVLFAACEAQENPSGETGVKGGKITIDQSVVEIPEEGSTISITVSAPEGAAISTRVESTAKTWISVNPGADNVFDVKVEMNDDLKARSAKVFFSSEGCTSATLVVSQAAAAEEKRLSVSSDVFNLEHLGGTISFTVDAYPAPTVEIVEGTDWITAGAVNGNEYSYNVAEWKTDAKGTVRSGSIKLTSVKSKDVIVTINQSSSEYVRRSLIAKVTGSWCGYCPFMSFAIEDALEKMGDALVPMYIYNGSGDLTTDAESQFSKTFGVTGYPTGLVDYRAFFQSYTVTASTQAELESIANESISELPSATGFDASCSVSGGKLNVDVTIYSTITEPELKLCVAVLQDGLISEQSFYGTASDYPEINFKQYVNDHVVRTWPTTYLGESVAVEAGKTVKKTYSVAMKSGWVAENMSVAIYTLRPFAEVQVRGLKGIKYTDKAGCYVDNVVAVHAGESVKVEYK